MEVFIKIEENINGKLVQCAICKYYASCLTCTSSRGIRHLRRHINETIKKCYNT